MIRRESCRRHGEIHCAAQAVSFGIGHRDMMAVGGLGMMIPGTLTDVAGLVLVAAVVAYQKISAKKHGGPVMTA